jgi:hypothetical protein
MTSTFIHFYGVNGKPGEIKQSLYKKTGQDIYPALSISL